MSIVCSIVRQMLVSSSSLAIQKLTQEPNKQEIRSSLVFWLNACSKDAFCILTFVVLDSTLLENFVHSLEVFIELRFGYEWAEILAEIGLRAQNVTQLPNQFSVLLALKDPHATVSLFDALLEDLRLLEGRRDWWWSLCARKQITRRVCIARAIAQLLTRLQSCILCHGPRLDLLLLLCTHFGKPVVRCFCRAISYDCACRWSSYRLNWLNGFDFCLGCGGEGESLLFWRWWLVCSLL